VEDDQGPDRRGFQRSFVLLPGGPSSCPPTSSRRRTTPTGWSSTSTRRKPRAGPSSPTRRTPRRTGRSRWSCPPARRRTRASPLSATKTRAPRGSSRVLDLHPGVVDRAAPAQVGEGVGGEGVGRRAPDPRGRQPWRKM